MQGGKESGLRREEAWAGCQGQVVPVGPQHLEAPCPCLCPPAPLGPAAFCSLPPAVPAGLRPSAGTRFSLLFPSFLLSYTPAPTTPLNARCCVCCSPRLSLFIQDLSQLPWVLTLCTGSSPWASRFLDICRGTAPPARRLHGPGPVCVPSFHLWALATAGPGGPGWRARDKRAPAGGPQERHERPRPWTKNSGFRSHLTS